MPDFLSDVEIDMTCPKCSHVTKKTIGGIKANSNILCAGCGDTFTVLLDTEKADGELGKLNKSLDSMNDALKKMGGK